MTGNVTVGVRLQGDSRGAVQSLTLTRTELGRLAREMQQTQRRTQDLGNEMSRRFRESVSDIVDLKGAMAGLVGVFAADQLIDFAREAVSSTAELGRMAAATQISADKLQTLTLAFQQFAPGTELDDVTDALATLSDEAQDAVTGSQDMAQNFALIGISVDELRGKHPDELFRLIAEHMQGTQDANMRLTAAVRLLGDDLGRKLLPLLVQGSDGLDKLSDNAHQAGLVLGDDLVNAAVKVDAQFKQLSQTMETGFKRATLSVVNRVQEMTGEFQDFKDMMGSALHEWFGWQTMPAPRAPAQPTQLKPITVTAPKLPNPADQFRPLDGFLSAVDEAHNAKFQSIDALNDKLKEVTDTSSQLKDMGTQVASTFASGFTDAILSGKSFGKVLENLIEQIGVMIIKLTIEFAIRTAMQALLFAANGKAFGPGGNVLPFAHGAAFDASGITKFASGGVVTSPTPFQYGGGRLGIMGERGAEAVMPLTRVGRDLGVKATGLAPIVQIIDNRGAGAPPVKVEQSRGQDGRMVIRATIEAEVKRMADSGALDSTLASNYGVKRKGRF